MNFALAVVAAFGFHLVAYLSATNGQQERCRVRLVVVAVTSNGWRRAMSDDAGGHPCVAEGALWTR